MDSSYSWIYFDNLAHAVLRRLATSPDVAACRLRLGILRLYHPMSKHISILRSTRATWAWYWLMCGASWASSSLFWLTFLLVFVYGWWLILARRTRIRHSMKQVLVLLHNLCRASQLYYILLSCTLCLPCAGIGVNWRYSLLLSVVFRQLLVYADTHYVWLGGRALLLRSFLEILSMCFQVRQ